MVGRAGAQRPHVVRLIGQVEDAFLQGRAIVEGAIIEVVHRVVGGVRQVRVRIGERSRLTVGAVIGDQIALRAHVELVVVWRFIGRLLVTDMAVDRQLVGQVPLAGQSDLVELVLVQLAAVFAAEGNIAGVGTGDVAAIVDGEVVEDRSGLKLRWPDATSGRVQGGGAEAFRSDAWPGAVRRGAW